MAENQEVEVEVENEVEEVEVVSSNVGESKKPAFSFDLSKEYCLVSDIKNLVNVVSKSLEKESDCDVSFAINISEKVSDDSTQQGFSFGVSKEFSTITEMKNLVNTLIKSLDAAQNVSFNLKLNSN